MFSNKKSYKFMGVVAVAFLLLGYSGAQAQSTDTTGGDLVIVRTVDAPTDPESEPTPAPSRGNAGGIMMSQTTPTAPTETPSFTTNPTTEIPPVKTPVKPIETPQPKLEVKTTEVLSDEPLSIPSVAGLEANAEASNDFNTKNVSLSVLALALLVFGVFKLSVRNTPQNKAKRHKKMCLHVGAIIDANLQEITSLQEKVEDMIKDKIESKKASKLINTIKDLKDKHEKYTKLFQNCVIKKDEKKKVVVVHSDDSLETKDWTRELGEKVKKMNFEHETMHTSDPKIQETIKNSDKDTIFVLHGDSANTHGEHLKSLEKEHIATSDMNEVLEKLKSF